MPLSDHEYKKMLQDSELGKSLNENELQMFLTYSKAVEIPMGEMILQQGKLAQGIYLVLQGNALVTAKLLGNGVAEIETLGPGDFLGEISFIEKVPCSATVTAKTNLQCLLITDIYYEMLTAYYQETKYKILGVLCKQVCHRLKRVYDKITTIISHSDMTTKSFLFGIVIESLTKPEQITFDECGLDINKLKKLPLFLLFTDDEIDALRKHTTLLKAPKNCKVLFEEEKKSVYIVINGAIQSAILKDNKVAKLSVIGPQTLFAGACSVIDNPAFTVNFATCERCILLKISEMDCEYFKDNFPLLWYKLFTLICRSLVVLEKSFDKLDIRLNIEMYNKAR